MGIVRDGNCQGWVLSGMGTVRDGNCPGIALEKQQLLSTWTIQRLIFELQREQVTDIFPSPLELCHYTQLLTPYIFP